MERERDCPEACSIDALMRLELGGATGEGDGSGETPRDPAAPEERGTSRCPPHLAMPPRDLFGLALSGGGIRSATFNLGLLQGLAAKRLLGCFDYLSTVSGGGYVGAFWTAWRSRPENQPPAGGGTPGFPTGTAAGSEPPEIRHLREFSNFLAPRLALLSVDTGRLAAALASGVLPALLAASAFIALVLVAWLIFARVVLDGPVGLSDLVLCGVPGLLLVAFEAWWYWNQRQDHVCPPSPTKPAARADAATSTDTSHQNDAADGTEPEKRRVEEGALHVYVLCSIVGVVGAWLAGRWLDSWFLRGQFAPESFALHVLGFHRPLDAFFAPAAVWGVAVLVLVVVRWISSPFIRNCRHQARRAALDRVVARLLFLVAAWTVVTVLWIAGSWVLDHGGTLFTLGGAAGSGGLFAWLRRLLVREPSRPAGGKVGAFLKPALLRALAYVTVGLLVVVVAIGILSVAGRFPEAHLWGLPLGFWGFAAAAAGVCLFTLVFFDPNEMGFHAFYRARLTRAYLGASVEHGRNPRVRATGPCRDDDLRFGEGGELECPVTSSRPVHLVCCTANDLTPRDPLAALHRGGESAVVSPVGFSVGERAVRWDRWKVERKLPQALAWLERWLFLDERPTLGAVMTAAGAAFNSHMGAKAKEFGPAVTFLLTALNLRLGLWLPHPRVVAERGRGRALVSRLFAGRRFFLELLGISRAHGGSVFLSDGGHFENLALYELVRRHCRYILVSDCGADRDVAFDDFGKAVRQVREDFGVEIEIDLSPLRPDAARSENLEPGPDGKPKRSRLARQPMVAGTIRYPEGDTGILLYFKPTLTGDEPPDVTQYARRNEAFPHENTLDQFFDEAQWESYRRLGEHAVDEAFAFLDREEISSSRPKQVFTEARFAWLPRPDGFEERFGQLAARQSALEASLARSAARRLEREVYREVDAIAPEPSTPLEELSGEELVATVRILGEAVQFMLEAFESLEEELVLDHPVALGWINSFARWTGAPLFRFWWPVLATRVPKRFADFLTSKYSLGARRAQLVQVSESPRGYAWGQWRATGGRKPAAGEEVWTLALSLADPVHEKARRRVTVATLLVTRVRWAGHPVAAWDSTDLFVPAGFWGVGLGGLLLEELVQQLGNHRFLVRVPGGQAWGEAPQLYRSRGFVQARAVERRAEGGAAARWWVEVPANRPGEEAVSIALPAVAGQARWREDSWLARLPAATKTP